MEPRFANFKWKFALWQLNDILIFLLTADYHIDHVLEILTILYKAV